MERCKKKDILSLIHTMFEANDSIVKALPAAPEELNEVFIQCQDAALQIGTHLENFGETYRPAVAILEDYCEKIYQMSIATSDENTCRKLGKKIRKQLSQLQNDIQYGMPEDRKEVVFLPYKASLSRTMIKILTGASGRSITRGIYTRNMFPLLNMMNTILKAAGLIKFLFITLMIIQIM